MAEYGKLNEVEIAEAKRLREVTSSMYLQHHLWQEGKETTPEYLAYAELRDQLWALQQLCEHIDCFIRCADCCQRDPSV